MQAGRSRVAKSRMKERNRRFVWRVFDALHAPRKPACPVAVAPVDRRSLSARNPCRVDRPHPQSLGEARSTRGRRIARTAARNQTPRHTTWHSCHIGQVARRQRPIGREVSSCSRRRNPKPFFDIGPPNFAAEIDLDLNESQALALCLGERLENNRRQGS